MEYTPWIPSEPDYAAIEANILRKKSTYTQEASAQRQAARGNGPDDMCATMGAVSNGPSPASPIQEALILLSDTIENTDSLLVLLAQRLSPVLVMVPCAPEPLSSGLSVKCPLVERLSLSIVALNTQRHLLRGLLDTLAL